MRDKPVNLNFFTIAFPVTAIASILHRISGIILLIFIPCFLWVLQNILSSPETFLQVNYFLTNNILTKFIAWLILTSLFYHLLAGIRHLIMDVGFGEGKRSARISTLVILFLTIIVSVSLGYSLC